MASKVSKVEGTIDKDVVARGTEKVSAKVEEKVGRATGGRQTEA
jgi:hypothetical protein